METIEFPNLSALLDIYKFGSHRIWISVLIAYHYPCNECVHSLLFHFNPTDDICFGNVILYLFLSQYCLQ